MEPDRRIRRIAIVGGGIAGWTAAVMLAQKARRTMFNPRRRSARGRCIRAWPRPRSPPMLELLRFLGIDQNDFIDKTQSTYSLGTRFTDWAAHGQSFWHPFGALGALIERRPFYHFWHKGKALGLKPRLELFSHEVSMAHGQSLHFPDQLARRRAATCVTRCTSTRGSRRATCARSPNAPASSGWSARLLAPRAAKTASSTNCSSRTAASCAPICTSTAAARARSSSAKFSGRPTTAGSTGCPATGWCTRRRRSRRRVRRTFASARAIRAGSGAFRCSRT